MRWMLGVAVAAGMGIAALAGNANAAWTPPSLAAQADPWDSARYYIGIKNSSEALRLIDSGAFDINMQNDEGYTLLHFAAEAGDLELVRAMLARGADANIKSNKPALLPYEMAYSTMVKAELRKAMAAPKGPAPAGGAPARAATGMCEMARNEPASASRSPAMRPFLKAKDAVWYNHPDELTGLIEDCVKVDQQDEWGWTLLHQAADRDRVALAKILLDHGASKSLRSKDGQTAAHLAKSPEMKALLGPAGPATPAAGGNSARDKECQQKQQADAALCSDSTCRMRTMRKWQQCLKTGNYW